MISSSLPVHGLGQSIRDYITLPDNSRDDTNRIQVQIVWLIDKKETACVK